MKQKINIAINSVILYLLTISFLGWSCGPRSAIPNKQAETDSVTVTPGPNQIMYAKNVIETGKKVFKENCTDCHCSPFALVEPPYTCKLRYAFDNLPMDSLSHYIDFVKNSSRTKKGLRKNPDSTEDWEKLDYVHAFENTMSDSLIQTVVEYLWLASKWRK